MAEESDNFIWLLTQESISHHETARKCQQLIQELMWERGRIELAYIHNLEKWAETLLQGLKQECPYPREVQDVLVLPAREAQAQATQHQQLYSNILSPDGPCIQMRKLIQSIEESVMVSDSNRVYSTAVSQYQAMVQKRQELEGEVRRKKQHYDHALSTSRNMDDRLDGRRHRNASRPMSARKVESMESRRYHLKKYSDVQLTQYRDQEVELESFMKSQRQPLQSIITDLNLFCRRRLSDTVGLTKVFLSVLSEHEQRDKREKKRATLHEIEKQTEVQTVTSLADQTITSLRDRVKQIVLELTVPKYSLQEIVGGSDTTKRCDPSQSSGHDAPEVESYRFRPSAPSPDCPQNRVRMGISEGGIPVQPAPNVYARSQIARVSHLLQVQSLQDELYRSKVNDPEPDVLPSPSTGTVQVFYASSTDSIVAKAGSNQHSASSSLGSESSVEMLPFPPEKLRESHVKPPFEVRNFCTEEEEEEEEDTGPRSGGRFRSIRKELRKKILWKDANVEPEVTFTQVVELIPGQLAKELDEFKMAAKITAVESDRTVHQNVHPTSSTSSSYRSYDAGNNVTTMSNVRVRALHSYAARSLKELSLEKDQIIKQKFGTDDAGFSYGWTRSNRLGPKRYGYYPADMVELETPDPEKRRHFDFSELDSRHYTRPTVPFVL